MSAWTDIVDEYRDLVVAPAKKDTLVRALGLMVRVVPVRLPDADSLKQHIASIEQEERRAREAFEQLSDDLQSFSEERFAMESLKRRRKLGYVRLQELCVRTSLLLQLTRILRTHDAPLRKREKSLAVDIGLVIFHSAYFWLVDQLPGSFRRERALLVGSFRDFADALADTPDALRVRALLHDLDGDQELAGWYWRECARRTDPASHEFMTALQAAWSHELERGEYVGAMLVLADAMQVVPEHHLDELRELVETTIEVSRVPSVA